MNKTILGHPLKRPLYAFLKECDASPLEKEVLDCGAGGMTPPLTLFYEAGYTTWGIDISDHALALADSFCQEHGGIDLGITKGDIREIPFEANSLSFLYSINTICHLSKKDTTIAMKEIERVLKPSGLCFINFASVADPRCGLGRELSKGEWVAVFESGEEVLHSFYEDDEADQYFEHFELIQKEKRVITLPNVRNGWRNGGWEVADVGYIAKKIK